jgi:hypothetical protein
MTSSSYDRPNLRIVVERGVKPNEVSNDVAESHDLNSLCMATVVGHPGYEALAETANEAVGMALRKMCPLALSRLARNFSWRLHPESGRPRSPELNDAHFVMLRDRQCAPVGAAAIANQISGVEVEFIPELPVPELL